MRRALWFRWAIAAVVAAIASSTGVAVWVVWTVNAEGPGRVPAVERFTVRDGESFAGVVGRLAGQGWIRSARALRWYAAARRVDRRIQSGTYRLVAGTPASAVVASMAAGDVWTTAVTVPEGFTTWDIAGAFRRAGVDSIAMLAAIRDSSTLARRRVPAQSLEGYLFPDTYRVGWLADPGEVVSMMLERTDRAFTADRIARAVALGLSPHQVLTLASIIEAETRVAKERALVSAVYYNRLGRGMRLEADPTVAYAKGGYRGRLLFADLEIDSPYNTYRRRGLPPGPICSPGAASIHAALYPDTTCHALYFVARGDGTHIFSRTLRGHRHAVKRARSGR